MDHQTDRPLRVLFAAQRWDYGEQSRGDSFEYTNFYLALEAMAGVEAAFVDTLGAFRTGGDDAVRRDVLQAVAAFRPAVIFFVLFEDEVRIDLLEDLRARADLQTFNWFCDDHWRFESFTQRYAPHFDLVSTTVRDALPKYAEIGCDSVMLTQWACNPVLYRPTPGVEIDAITFVGQVHSDRRWVIRRLRRAGVPVRAWGRGWDEGRLSQEEMIGVFSRSKVNLNLSEASNNPAIPRLLRGAISRTYPPLFRLIPHGDLRQIKGRNFEIPACGGFQLSGRAPDLERYYEPDREIVLYGDDHDLVDKARFYLRNDVPRRQIAEAGYERTLRDHTYEQRFRAIFDRLTDR